MRLWLVEKRISQQPRASENVVDSYPPILLLRNFKRISYCRNVCRYVSHVSALNFGIFFNFQGTLLFWSTPSVPGNTTTCVCCGKPQLQARFICVLYLRNGIDSQRSLFMTSICFFFLEVSGNSVNIYLYLPSPSHFHRSHLSFQLYRCTHVAKNWSLSLEIC